MVTRMTANAVRRSRLRHQRLVAPRRTDPVTVVADAVAFQGQDPGSVLAAIALRAGATVADVVRAFDEGSLVRSWPMRGTLFATTPAHLATLLHHTGPRIHRSTVRRRERLGLDERTLRRAGEVLAAALAERPLTRAEALDRWRRAGIATDGGRGYHLLMHHAVAGLAHWGRFDEDGTEQLLELSTVPPPADPDAALAAVVRSWLAFRGPAREADLAWWTKLPRSVLRPALARIEDLAEVEVAGADGPFLMVGQERPRAPSSGITLVPGFDEWLLGYEDRSLIGSPAALTALVPGGNGVFRPAILDDGRLVGTWRTSRIPRRAAGGRAARRPAGAYELVEDLPAARHEELEHALAAWGSALQ